MTNEERARQVNLGSACWCDVRSPDSICERHQAIATALSLATDAERVEKLEAALQGIFDDYEDDCGCECDGPTCCFKVKEVCAKCSARAALLRTGDDQ